MQLPEPSLEEIKEEFEIDEIRKAEFAKELEQLINKYSVENGSNTPDFLLAEYLIGCLKNFDLIVNKRTQWYRETDKLERDDEKDKLKKKLQFAVKSIVSASFCSNPKKANEMRQFVLLDNLDLIDETTKKLLGL